MSVASRAAARLAATIAMLVLAGCATVPRGDASSAGETLSGRLSVRVEADGTAPARSVSAAFELHGDPNAGRLDLSTPLGSMLAQARWSPIRVVLATPKGESDFRDLDSLTREMLGESLPVAALFDWLHGRPWPGAPSTPSVPAANSGGGFEQLGWTVDLGRFADAVVSAHRESPPLVTVRIKLDRP